VARADGDERDAGCRLRATRERHFGALLYQTVLEARLVRTTDGHRRPGPNHSPAMPSTSPGPSPAQVRVQSAANPCEGQRRGEQLHSLPCVCSYPGESSAASTPGSSTSPNRPGTDFLDPSRSRCGCLAWRTLRFRFVAGQTTTAPVIDRSLLYWATPCSRQPCLCIEVRSIPAGATAAVRGYQERHIRSQRSRRSAWNLLPRQPGSLESENLGYGNRRLRLLVAAQTSMASPSNDAPGYDLAQLTGQHLRTTVVDSQSWPPARTR